jgi:hypothetical protein
MGIKPMNQKHIFLLNSNKTITDPLRLPFSLHYLIIGIIILVHDTLSLILRNMKYKWRSDMELHSSRVLFIGLSKTLKCP